MSIQVAFFQLVVVDLAIEQPLQKLQVSLKVIGMGDVLVVQLKKLTAAVTQHCAECIVDLKPTAIQAHHGHTLRRGIECPAETLLANAQSILCLLAVTDIPDESGHPEQRPPLVVLTAPFLSHPYAVAIRVLQPIGQFERLFSFDSADGLIGNMQVIRVDHTRIRSNSIIDKVAGRKAGQFSNLVTHKAHGPLGIILTPVNHARQVGNQATKAAFTFLQRTCCGLKLTDITGNTQKSGDLTVLIEHGTDGQVNLALTVILALVSPLPGFGFAAAGLVNKHLKPADHHPKLLA